MNLKNINAKISNIFDRLKSPKYTIKGWIIVEPELYEKRKNKTIIKRINNIVIEQINNEYTCSIICETKNEFIYVKYNTQFIGEVRSQTEYGLILNSYDIYAVNSEIFETTPPFSKNKISINDIFNILGYKLSKEAKEYIELRI